MFDQLGYYSLENVTVKMETPVLYFYSSDSSEKNVDVKVDFQNGSISQWYPNRTDGESKITPTVTTGVYSSAPGEIIDFSLPQDGWIRWNATVLPSTDQRPYTDNALQETQTWTSPRTTKSNLVMIKNGDVYYDTLAHQWFPLNQVEKFLFYRGFGNFREPIQVEFNTKGNLVITNVGEDPISYALVYEKRKDGKVLIWRSDSLSVGRKKVVARPENKSPTDSSAEHENFVKHLISAGLYEDEARAMLKTWEESYFGHEGLKVFWIVPRKFTDGILPIQVAPAPNNLQRVMVGRSEILTPEFEKQLAATQDSLYSVYKDDRFLFAYQELIRDTIPSEWTDYNELDKTTAVESQSLKSALIELFPNPVTGDLTIKLGGPGKIRVFSSEGMLMRIMEDASGGENKISMTSLADGIYMVKIECADGAIYSKKVVKN